MGYCICGRRGMLTDYLCGICYDAWLAKHVPDTGPRRAAYRKTVAS